MRGCALLAATALVAGVFAPSIGWARSPSSPGQIIQSLTPPRAPAPTKRGSFVTNSDEVGRTGRVKPGTIATPATPQAQIGTPARTDETLVVSPSRQRPSG
jgi:hypothetical protein